MNYPSLLICLLLLLSLGGCSLTNHHATELMPEERPALTEHERELARSGNQFGWTLFRTVSDAEPGANVSLSPLSISMALGMTLNGARSDTRDAMHAALELSELDINDVNTSYERLAQRLVELDPSVSLTLAHSIWYRSGFEIEPVFVEANQTHFDAEVRAIEFGSPDVIGTINRWVATHTAGKIDRIVDRIDAREVLFLINALDFEGTWRYAFAAEATADAAFTQYDGTTTQVPTMQLRTDLPYLETDSFRAVDLPYGDSLYSMTLLLPHADRDVEKLVATLDAGQWDAWLEGFTAQPVDLRLPRFTLTDENQLNTVLKALGMELAFRCGTADFSGIHPGEALCISRVTHKSQVAVDEEGTEAAAATAVGIQTTSARNEAVSMHVNRPFVFVIRERHTGTLLFTGKVAHL